jgi:hypothetical protein
MKTMNYDKHNAQMLEYYKIFDIKNPSKKEFGQYEYMPKPEWREETFVIMHPPKNINIRYMNTDISIGTSNNDKCTFGYTINFGNGIASSGATVADKPYENKKAAKIAALNFVMNRLTHEEQKEAQRCSESFAPDNDIAFIRASIKACKELIFNEHQNKLFN